MLERPSKPCALSNLLAIGADLTDTINICGAGSLEEWAYENAWPTDVCDIYVSTTRAHIETCPIIKIRNTTHYSHSQKKSTRAIGTKIKTGAFSVLVFRAIFGGALIIVIVARRENT